MAEDDFMVYLTDFFKSIGAESEQKIVLSNEAFFKFKEKVRVLMDDSIKFPSEGVTGDKFYIQAYGYSFEVENIFKG